MWRSTNAKNRTSSHRERHRQPDELGTFASPGTSRSLRRSPDDRNPTSQAGTRRRSLLKLHARMQQDISQTADSLLLDGREFASALPDTADMVRELCEQDVAASLLVNVSNTVDQIQAALDRMDEGGYGYCEDCGSRIPEERLEALPYATQCVQCAGRREAETGR